MPLIEQLFFKPAMIASCCHELCQQVPQTMMHSYQYHTIHETIYELEKIVCIDNKNLQ